MSIQFTHLYQSKKRKIEKHSAFDQIKEIETRFRFDLIKVGNLLFKMQQNGESARSIELTKSILAKVSDTIRSLRQIKSHIRRS
jgi:hypothetical protein